MRIKRNVLDPVTGMVTAVEMNREAWKTTHRDFKSGRLGKDATVLTYCPKTGGSVLVPAVLVKE
jgi:hypothetical protein